MKISIIRISLDSVSLLRSDSAMSESESTCTSFNMLLCSSLKNQRRTTFGVGVPDLQAVMLPQQGPQTNVRPRVPSCRCWLKPGFCTIKHARIFNLKDSAIISQRPDHLGPHNPRTEMHTRIHALHLPQLSKYKSDKPQSSSNYTLIEALNVGNLQNIKLKQSTMHYGTSNRAIFQSH